MQADALTYSSLGSESLQGDPVVLFVLEISQLLNFDIGSLVKHKLCQQPLITPFEQPEAIQFQLKSAIAAEPLALELPSCTEREIFFTIDASHKRLSKALLDQVDNCYR